jgi:Fe-S-cluster containining protein
MRFLGVKEKFKMNFQLLILYYPMNIVKIIFLYNEVSMEINKQMIKTSLDLVKTNNLTSNLEGVYQKIPSGKCNGCAKCCTESVHAFYIEFLNIYNYVIQHDMLEKVMEKVRHHYFNELTEHMPCPFLNEDKSCIIYEVRPYVCRLFGHATREEHERNYENVLEQNLAADEYFYEEYGVHLSKEVVYHKIDFCEYFKSEIPFSQSEKMQLIDKLFVLDTHFLKDDLLPEEMLNMSITNWFIYTEYDEEQASEIRIEKLTNGK